MNNFVLAMEQTERILKLGLRPVDVSKMYQTKEVVSAYLLIPTKDSKWHQIQTEWDGSYIPLLIYKVHWYNIKGRLLCKEQNATTFTIRDQNSCVLIPYGEREYWQRELADKLSDILELNVKAMED